MKSLGLKLLALLTAALLLAHCGAASRTEAPTASPTNTPSVEKGVEMTDAERAIIRSLNLPQTCGTFKDDTLKDGTILHRSTTASQTWTFTAMESMNGYTPILLYTNLTWFTPVISETVTAKAGETFAVNAHVVIPKDVSGRVLAVYGFERPNKSRCGEIFWVLVEIPT